MEVWKLVCHRILIKEKSFVFFFFLQFWNGVRCKLFYSVTEISLTLFSLLRVYISQIFFINLHLLFNFFRIARKKAELQDINSELWEKLQLPFFKESLTFFFAFVGLYLTNQTILLRIVSLYIQILCLYHKISNFFSQNWEKKKPWELWGLKSCTYLFFWVYLIILNLCHNSFISELWEKKW